MALMPEHPHWIERLMRQARDPRVQSWPMMGSPAWPLTVVAAYLYFVLSYGPQMMKTRSAYSFKTFITFYNIYQVIANSAAFYTVLTSGWTSHYSLGCQFVDRSENPEAVRMAHAMWWWFLMKKTELIETVLFVLRKKHRQISFLHVYHHVSTYLIAWMACNFTPGGMASFVVMPNSLVHVFMYSYYLLSTIDNGPLQKTLNGVKRFLTTMQVIQLTIIVLHSTQAMLPSCNAVPKALAVFFIPNVLLVMSLFFNFYMKNYSKSSSLAAMATAPAPAQLQASDQSCVTAKQHGD